MLCIFSRVVISEHVRTELRQIAGPRWRRSLPAECLRVARVSEAELLRQQDIIPSCKAHSADLSVAALARRLCPEAVLTDDLALRTGLQSSGYRVVGSVGVLIRAARKGLIGRESLDEALDRLFDGSTLYTSRAFRSKVRELLKNEL